MFSSLTDSNRRWGNADLLWDGTGCRFADKGAGIELFKINLISIFPSVLVSSSFSGAKIAKKEKCEVGEKCQRKKYDSDLHLPLSSFNSVLATFPGFHFCNSLAGHYFGGK